MQFEILNDNVEPNIINIICPNILCNTIDFLCLCSLGPPVWTCYGTPNRNCPGGPAHCHAPDPGSFGADK